MPVLGHIVDLIRNVTLSRFQFWAIGLIYSSSGPASHIFSYLVCPHQFLEPFFSLRYNTQFVQDNLRRCLLICTVVTLSTAVCTSDSFVLTNVVPKKRRPQALLFHGHSRKGLFFYMV